MPGNEFLLLAYVCFIKGESLAQKLLFARILRTDLKGESISHVASKTRISLLREAEMPVQLMGRHQGLIAAMGVLLP